VAGSNVLKQTALSLGAEAAVHGGVIATLLRYFSSIKLIILSSSFKDEIVLENRILISLSEIFSRRGINFKRIEFLLKRVE